MLTFVDNEDELFQRSVAMKAWLISDFNGLGGMRLMDVADPWAGTNEVVLAVEYASLNPADRYLSQGHYPAKPPLPHILGRDGVGTVIEVGSGVSTFKLGQRLMILRGEVGVNRAGTFAEKVAVPAEYLQPIPQGWTAKESAAASLVYLTAQQALTQWGELPPSTVLITGASGGVGVASVQLSAAMGHRAIGLSRDSAKREKLKALGAVAVFDPGDSQWTKKVREFLSPKKVDLAIDNVGGALLPQVIETLGYLGKISLVGALAGPVPSFNSATLFFRRLKMGGVAVGTYNHVEAHAAWDQIVTLLKKTGAKPLVDGVFGFADLNAAFEHLEKGPMGKVVLAVGGESV